MGMGISGGEEGARNGPSLMPGGPKEAYALIEPIMVKAAAQVRIYVCCLDACVFVCVTGGLGPEGQNVANARPARQPPAFIPLNQTPPPHTRIHYNR